MTTAQLVASVCAAESLPIIAAGGLATAEQITEVMQAGAQAAMVGTVLLRSEESGASATYKDALAANQHAETVVTRAFTGRPARALRNRFTDRYSAEAPLGYPALHHLTSSLRKAAAEHRDPELLHLWAGVGHRHARVAPVNEILGELVAAV
jgi:NAD(P)H-dependent flavin oxidoreductase YrpB (nitropropane dioxygenase family)